jgi:tetratricopeptide (TPR) repeat protein
MKLGFRQFRVFASAILVATSSLSCLNEALEKQAGQIREQEAEIARQRKELEALAAGQQVQDQKQRDCVRAFREYFDKAQLSTNRDDAISLYRQGLAICPDDDVAHYELGRALASSGQLAEAEKEFEAALKVNANFTDARKQLEAIRKNR